MVFEGRVTGTHGVVGHAHDPEYVLLLFLLALIFVCFQLFSVPILFVIFDLGRSRLLVGLNLFQILTLHVTKEVTARAQVCDALGG